MILGIISDTHDVLPAIHNAFNIFAKHKVQTVIHCGDWKTAETVTYFASEAVKKNIKVYSVFGNRDVERDTILKTNASLNHPIFIDESELVKVVIAGKKIMAYHGHHRPTLIKIITSNEYDVVCTGHTHKPRIEQISNTLIINPGSTAFKIPRQKNSKPSIALYNTESNTAEILEFEM